MESTILEQRLEKVRQKIAENGAEGLLIGSPYNRRWVSGFRGSAGWLLITADRALLGTDFRYWEQAVEQAPCFELFKLNTDNTQHDMVRAAQVQRVAFEPQHVPVSEYKKLQEVEGIEWLHSNGLVEELRLVKDSAELDKIRRAAGITDTAMQQVKNLARIGMTERALAWELEKFMREEGATGLTFPVIVASGPNAALPHYSPADRRIEAGDILLVDMGASVESYGSDLTRTFLVGQSSNPIYDERFSLVLKAHDAAIAAVRVGASGREIDAVARDLLDAAGYGDKFGHGLGHGLGLEGHEGPRLGTTRADTELAPGMVATIEPGVYFPGWGGIRIEDLILVTDAGAERLSHCPIEPLLALE
ncbi:MAG: M24 family metallopeptidase [Chloroflexota bacterium]